MPAARHSRKVRILLADDHAFIRKAVRTILEAHEGWEICGEAENGQEAVEQTAQLHPDVIVMDIFMPCVGGLEATRRIHKSFPESHVVILTLYALPDLDEAVREAGAEGCVIKTDSDHSLVPAIESVTNAL